jgi:NTE family protein
VITGLVLTGGGARAAYQAGALRAIARITRAARIPFQVLAGSSAGAINTVALATGADDFQGATARLWHTWGGIAPERVYRTDPRRLLGIGARWLRDLTSGGVLGDRTINYLLDTAPLRELLAANLEPGRLPAQYRAGLLRGVAVSATSYSSANGITFFDGDPGIAPWVRSVRVGVRDPITLDHVMASTAIPIFFPPVRLGQMFFGDGCIRMLAPVSPAVHLGAERILAIGVRHRPSAEETIDELRPDAHPAPLSQILGTLLSSLFLDSIEADGERLERINRTLQLIPPHRRSSQALRIIPLLVLRPSRDLGELAEGAQLRLPGMLQYLLRGIGARNQAGRDLLSYLAFERVYVRRLLRLGYRDTLARRDELEAFLAGEPPAADREPAPLETARG